MIEGNQGKKVLLSIVAILVLVVAVAGVTFAFFTYSRTGAAHNVITTGKVSFVFADGNFINLTNAFPISTASGVALSGTGKTCTFTITGNTSSGAINYSIWAIPGDNSNSVSTIDNSYTTKFGNDEIYINIQSADVTGTTFTGASGATGSGSTAGKAISSLATSASGFTRPSGGYLLGTGTITSTTEVSRTFTVRIWVSDSVVYVDDAGGSHHYTSGAYGKMYYTMKIQVLAAQ